MKSHLKFLKDIKFRKKLFDRMFFKENTPNMILDNVIEKLGSFKYISKYYHPNLWNDKKISTKIIDTGVHRNKVEVFNKITSLVINLIGTVTTDNPNEQEIIVCKCAEIEVSKTLGIYPARQWRNNCAYPNAKKNTKKGYS